MTDCLAIERSATTQDDIIIALLLPFKTVYEKNMLPPRFTLGSLRENGTLGILKTILKITYFHLQFDFSLLP